MDMLMPLPNAPALRRSLALLLSTALCLTLATPLPLAAQAKDKDKLPATFPLPQDSGPAALTQVLRKLQHSGRLMQTTAHPDDEDGGMLTLQARGRGASVLLLTLTRGEGGQNKIGSNLFDSLGVLRTDELFASSKTMRSVPPANGFQVPGSSANRCNVSFRLAVVFNS